MATCKAKGQEVVWLLNALKIETVFPEEGKNRGEGEKEMNDEAQYGGGGDTEPGHRTGFSRLRPPPSGEKEDSEEQPRAQREERS